MTDSPSTTAVLVALAWVALGGVTCVHRDDATQTPSQVSSPQVSAASMTEISLERRCMGCDREMKVTLRRDGTATKTMFGNARRRTADRHSTATMAPAAFEDVAKAVVAGGFFQMLDDYRDPQLADGESLTLAVRAGDSQKSVLESNGTGPAALKRLQSRIEEVANALTWKDFTPWPRPGD